MKLGPWELGRPLMLAPMAGLSDFPFRTICREMGATYAVGEMASSLPGLRASPKSSTRWAEPREPSPRVVQILGADPGRMAGAARWAEETGADVVDINMGCPAKKVLRRACGSALMREPALVGKIFEAVVRAVSIPVTVKIRTGWSETEKNALEIARLAEAAGLALVVLHGRTREQGFRGCAEYETAREGKRAVSIPLVVNGDIDSGAKARRVLEETLADGLMVGRAAVGRPWIFRDIAGALSGEGTAPARPPLGVLRRVVLRHAELHFDYYGGQRGVASFRKHLFGYFAPYPQAASGLAALREETDAKRARTHILQIFDDIQAAQARSS